METSVFPKNMLDSSLTIEVVAAKLIYFETQLQLLHWQTQSYAEHMALGSLYEFVHDFRDGVIEKLMGYTGKRVRAPKVIPVVDGITSSSVVNDLENFAQNLVQWSGANKYADIENLAQSLSGEAVKTKYLLTLS